MNDISKYQTLHDNGADMNEAYRTLRQDGLNEIDGIRMLREVYGLPLIDAKKLAYEIDTGESAEKADPELEKGITDVLDDLFGDES